MYQVYTIFTWLLWLLLTNHVLELDAATAQGQPLFEAII